MSKRKIQEILHFRKDLPPFLVHLTRTRNAVDPNHQMIDPLEENIPTIEHKAPDNLISIFDSKTLRQSKEHISSMRFAIDQKTKNSLGKLEEFFAAICVTETPLESIHCLIDIQGRQVNLEPFGVVFLKDKLKEKNFHPALYFNNSDKGHVDPILQAIGKIVLTDPCEAKEFFPLITTFGHMIGLGSGKHDFYWEREWRRPFCHGDFQFSLDEDVFCGLCPDGEISTFEKKYSGLPFIDPTRPLSWYAQKLIKRRKDLEIEHSVV